jgi:hypothetical protein
MSEWNGKLIEDMNSGHIENTLRLLEKQAKQACKKAHGSDWKLYVNNSYFDLKEDLEKRDHNF